MNNQLPLPLMGAERQRALRGFRLYLGAGILDGSCRARLRSIYQRREPGERDRRIRPDLAAARLAMARAASRREHAEQQGRQDVSAAAFASCPELALVRDVADAGKHRGLGRADVQVREVAKTWPRNTRPLTIGLDNGTEHNITDVLLHVVEYFRKIHFSK